MKVNVRERGETLLSTSTWDAISGDPGFLTLVDKSILSAEPAKGRLGWRLKAGAYVGRATLNGVDVTIGKRSLEQPTLFSRRSRREVFDTCKRL